MNYKVYTILAAVTWITCACQKTIKEDEVLSQTYMHKYGYAVSKEEWQEKNYPGQMISSLKNGVTVTATYEDNKLHGPCTYTYPNSHTVEKYILYNQNEPAKEILYDIAGMPTQETLHLSTDRYALTTWYADGVPKSSEEYSVNQIMEGKYFSPTNELEATVEQGLGTRIIRDVTGILSCKDSIIDGVLVRRETFYPTGSPETVSYYYKGLLSGQKQIFTKQGEPLSVEQWANGHLHGISTYYKNGTKEVEISFLHGKKHGLETHFLDGETIIHQISWDLDHKHGPEMFFVADSKKIVWNYEGKEISQARFQELSHLDESLAKNQD